MRIFFLRGLLVFLFVLSGFGVFAQIKIGALGGINSSNLFGDTPEHAHYRSSVGLYSGIEFDFYVHKNIAISIQPAFSNEGAKLFYNVQGMPELVDSGKVNFQYLRVPVLAKISSNKQRFYALAGFDFGNLLKGNVKLNNQEEEDIRESINKNDFSFHTGIGYRWKLKTLTLFVEGRYTLGLENLRTDESEELNYFPRVKNNSLKVLFGLEFAIWNPDNLKN